MTKATTRAEWGWSVLALAGLSYWFWLGFPFANHNESYAWIAQFASMDLRAALTHHLIGVANVRPLGTGGAWLAYRASHGSIVPVELFNYALAVVAWAALALRHPQRRVFALTALGVGAVLFSGYVYLFHLHGIFYSPLLAWIALLLIQDQGSVTRSRLALLFAAALVTALFHPFALPLFAAWALGSWLERDGGRPRLPIASAVAVIVVSGVLTRVLLTGAKSLPIGPQTWSGLVVSYRMVEIHPAVTVFALLLIEITALGTRLPRSARLVYAALLLAAGMLVARMSGSALPVWILACGVKLALERRWSWAGMLALAAIFPVAYPTGSPTYTVPAWMICAATLALHTEPLERALARVPRVTPWAAAVLVLIAAFAVRGGERVPALSRLAEPLLAERERTYQLERVLDWALDSPRREEPIVLYREARSPSEAANAVERRHRPPTQMVHLSRYLEQRRPGPGRGSSRLLVTFGDEEVPGAQLVYRAPSAHAGEVRVYETAASDPGTERAPKP